MRAALYARFSTDGQSPASIADQLVGCRKLADRLGARIVGEFSDAAISGQAMANRPGVNGLMALAEAGGCDLVIAEHTDRLSRGGSQSWSIYEDLTALGVRYETVNQGPVTPMHVGIGATISVMQIQEGAKKTWRGLEGVVKAGRSAGGLTYGYAKTRLYDAAGEPVRGLLEVDPARAEVVVRIFRDYAAGASPRAIAAALNIEAVPGPRGGPWNASTIHGNAKRGNGIIHNELYRGVRVWGRQAYSKDRRTGKRRGRLASGDNLTRSEVPELRIVDDALWSAVQRRYASVSALAAGGRPTGARRPKSLLSGLIKCGVCGGNMNLTGTRDALRCHTRVERGAGHCDNRRTPSYAGLEARVVAAIQANLLHPDVIEAAVRELREEAARLRKDESRQRHHVEKSLAEAQRRAERLIDQLEAGTPWAAIAERHTAITAQIEALKLDLDEKPAEIIALHPAAGGVYRRLIEGLQAALANPADIESREAREAVRALISAIRVIPLPAFGQYQLEIVGDLAPMLRTNEESPLSGAFAVPDQSMRDLGAGTRITPRHTLAAPIRMIA